MKRLMAIFLLIMLIIGCSKVSDEQQITAPQNENGNGFKTASAGGVTLQYKVDADSLHCILSAQTEGWVSVGFNPSSRMADANFIIGAVVNGTAIIQDEWGSGQTSHQSDASLGGVSNVRLVSGTETGGITQIEFKIPLNSGDAFDRTLTAGQTYPVILGRASSDSFTAKHNAIGQANITL